MKNVTSRQLRKLEVGVRFPAEALAVPPASLGNARRSGLEQVGICPDSATTESPSELNARSPARSSDRFNAALLSLSSFDAAFLARLRKRFAAKWRLDNATGCHVWTGAITAAGYGNIGVGSRGHGTSIVRAAHRIAWLLERGDIPAGLVCDHLCRNTKCVNSAHLELVTQQENAQRGLLGDLHVATCEHDRTLPGALTTKGRCRACYNSQQQKWRRGKREKHVMSPASRRLPPLVEAAR